MDWDSFFNTHKSAEIVETLAMYMKEKGVAFDGPPNLKDSSPYAKLQGGSSLGYRTSSRKWKKTGIVFFCTKIDADNLLLSLKLPIDDNSTDPARPYAVFVPTDKFEKAIEILKKNPLNISTEGRGDIESSIIKSLNAKGNVKLIKKENGELYVLKQYDVYNRSVFEKLLSLDLQGIPKIVELEDAGNKLCITEEYIDGEDLKKFIENHGLLSETEMIIIARQLLDILKRLHGLKPAIIHRDIKPSNIILTQRNEIYLVDFNASKKFDKQKNEDTVLIGTQFFAAPEQLLGYGSSSPATDIYGLGATLNYLLTGAYPNQAIYPGKYKDILIKCTKMDPADRYQTIAELEQAINNV